VKKKTFDAVAFMRKRREELSRAYAGLSGEQIEERIHTGREERSLLERTGTVENHRRRYWTFVILQ
jgi:hypothetical protein